MKKKSLRIVIADNESIIRMDLREMLEDAGHEIVGEAIGSRPREVLVPPDYFKDAINPGANPEPWMKAIMVTMADAAMMRRAVDITVSTGPRWSMEVLYP